MITFFINRNKDLKDLYEMNTKNRNDNHYGTFDQFLELIYSFRQKNGFDFTFIQRLHRNKIGFYTFEVKTDEGVEIDFDIKAYEDLRIKITTERKGGEYDNPCNLGEPVWIVKNGKREILGFSRTKKVRVFEFFVFSSLIEFYKFIKWTNKAQEKRSIFSEKEKKLLKSKESEKARLDVNFNYWGLDKESKKIYNMKADELDKVLKLDPHKEAFEELARNERALIARGK